MSSPAPSTSYLPANVDYIWLVICGGIACFAMAWGIGANDVANWHHDNTVKDMTQFVHNFMQFWNIGWSQSHHIETSSMYFSII